MMAEEARRGRPPRLTRETVARAVPEAGFPRLTFTAVWEHLRVGESTLFRYAPDRNEPVRPGLGLTMESVEMPPRQGPWQQVLTDYAVFAQCFWEAYPGSATEVSRGIFTLVMVRLSGELCSFLIERGFTTRDTLLTCDLIFDIVVDSHHGVEHMDGLLAEAGPERNDMKRRWVPDEPEENPAPNWEKIHQVKLEAVNLSPFDWFMKKLGVILAGVAVSLAP